MERKGGNTAVVTASTVTSALARVKVSQTEEQVLRMRHGATVEKTTTLPQAHEGNEELEDELLLLEMRLLSALKRHRAMATAGAPKVSAAKNPAKSKIVSALKKKKR